MRFFPIQDSALQDLPSYIAPLPIRAARDGGQVAGVLHHVMIRGMEERREISLDDKDRSSFLDRPGDILLESATSC